MTTSAAAGLNLIRNLLDSVPDTKVADVPIVFPKLTGNLANERFTGPVKPIRGPY